MNSFTDNLPSFIKISYIFRKLITFLNKSMQKSHPQRPSITLTRNLFTFMLIIIKATLNPISFLQTTQLRLLSGFSKLKIVLQMSINIQNPWIAQLSSSTLGGNYVFFFPGIRNMLPCQVNSASLNFISLDSSF